MKKSLSVILLVFIIIVCYFLFLSHKGFNIIIKNETNKKISGLSFTNQITENKIPTISPDKKYEFKVTTIGDFDLKYKDQNGELNSIPVIGIVEKGFSGVATVTLKTIDENGFIEAEVSQEMSIFGILK